MKGQINESPLEECRNIYRKSGMNLSVKGLHLGITDDLICAWNKTTRVETCEGSCIELTNQKVNYLIYLLNLFLSYSGDSGSALKILGNFERYYVVGITSFGFSCGAALPAFYTRVPNYISWIEDLVWPVE